LLDRPAQQCARTDNRFMTDQLVERARAHPGGEGSFFLALAIAVRGEEIEIHAASGTCRRSGLKGVLARFDRFGFGVKIGHFRDDILAAHHIVIAHGGEQILQPACAIVGNAIAGSILGERQRLINLIPGGQVEIIEFFDHLFERVDIRNDAVDIALIVGAWLTGIEISWIFR
jgi:hypothetical protein